jgi:hypothetical protein
VAAPVFQAFVRFAMATVAVLAWCRWRGVRLGSAVPALTTTAAQFAADGASASAQQAGNLADGVIGSQEAVDLVSFFSAEVLVHRATWTWRFERP